MDHQARWFCCNQFCSLNHLTVRPCSLVPVWKVVVFLYFNNIPTNREELFLKIKHNVNQIYFSGVKLILLL